ncbi:pyridoxamine 5'-phosphate oxidase family protein [Actinoplanes sp. HUAS TT8]|uniref:pyridoxamine 5'-phosphate oxidase family protein n=1 Tax=Actinoplanes sp. HUAS TT8 TaxID=3447453 RepID=UPI003F521958
MSVFHHGELAAQKRAGLLDHAAHVSAIIGPRIPGMARTFLDEQPMLVIGAADRDGHVWATQLTGRIRVTGPSAITVASAPAPGNPLHEVLSEPARVGMIGIEPGTRRRIRMNGTAFPTPKGLRVELDQVYANCPKYIQQRESWLEPATPGAPRDGDRLTGEQMAFAAATDTFFVASTGPDGSFDASHRGGNPGFLQVLSPTRLRWPDYNGNAMFNTLGNLEADPRAGLLLPDWSTGALLHLSGTAVVDWDPAHAAAVPGAERLVDFTVERVVAIENASPLRWTRPVMSRFNPAA